MATKKPQEDIHTQVQLIAQDVRYMREDLKEFRMEVREDLVTRREFTPVKYIAYGLVSAVGTGLVGLGLSQLIDGAV